MLSEGKFRYKALAVIYFGVTFTLVGFAIVSLVQGIKLQFAENIAESLAFYVVTPLLVFVSYLSYKKAHYKIEVLARSKL